VGRILNKLEELGLAETTVVIFTSDNGGYINNFRGQAVTNNFPLRSGKGSLYEGGVRVPLLIRWPGTAKPGGVCNRPVCSIDFYRTILEMAGLPGDAKHNAGVDGLSLVPLLRDPGASWARNELYFHYPHYYETTTPVSAVRAGEWKLLEYLEDGRLELYNLAKDPSESRNLAAEMPDVAAKLRAQLGQWRQRVNAQMPAANPGYRGQ